MTKAVLVIDMPENCADCQLADDDPSGLYCPLADDYYDGTDSTEDKASWCPLRELPERMEVCGTYNAAYYAKGGKMPSYKTGWNACLDEILKGPQNETTK